MAENPEARRYQWDSLDAEKVAEGLWRRVIPGERVMLAHFHLAKGVVVATHSHPNEQVSHLLQGTLRFLVGEQREEVVLRAGEVLHLPSGVPHSAEALEDCVAVDAFSPPREEWLRK
jgi:quercetin dioxygenase-like cupin family protein